MVHSRKTKVCGECGTVLPWVLMEHHAEQLSEDRRWARELAENVTAAAFGMTGTRENPQWQSQESVAPEELLERLSYAEAFRRRPRPYFWLYVLGHVLFVPPLWFVHFRLKGSPPFPWIEILVMAAALYATWRWVSPVCPRCRQNIQACPAEHCHVCGGPLTRRQCARCDVDHNWTGWFRRDRGGRLAWIKYCPGCAVQLDTDITRWRRRE